VRSSELADDDEGTCFRNTSCFMIQMKIISRFTITKHSTVKKIHYRMRTIIVVWYDKLISCDLLILCTSSFPFQPLNRYSSSSHATTTYDSGALSAASYTLCMEFSRDIRPPKASIISRNSPRSDGDMKKASPWKENLLALPICCFWDYILLPSLRQRGGFDWAS